MNGEFDFDFVPLTLTPCERIVLSEFDLRLLDGDGDDDDDVNTNNNGPPNDGASTKRRRRGHRVRSREPATTKIATKATKRTAMMTHFSSRRDSFHDDDIVRLLRRLDTRSLDKLYETLRFRSARSNKPRNNGHGG